MYFYINIQTGEVHKETCEYANPAKYPNIKFLGIFNYPSEAIRYAKNQGFYNADGCAYCCSTAHTR